jgi:hypothetical protein
MNSARAVAFGLLVALGPLGQAAVSPLTDTRTALEKWVETRQLISTEKTEWAEEKSTLEASREMFAKELEELAAKFAQLGQGNAEVAKERANLESEKAELQALRDAAVGKAAELERRLPSLISRLPDVLIQRLKPLTDRLPNDPGSTRLTPSERFRELVGILNEIDKFASSISVESEIRSTVEGNEVEVQTMYLGLAQAYFVGEAGNFAGVGIPAPGGWGWEWSTRNELAPVVTKAIAIYRNQQPAAFVALPVIVH